MRKSSENVIKLIEHAYAEKPTRQELENIATPCRRVFVPNPQVSDYDGAFEEGAELPRGLQQHSDRSVVIGFAIIVVIVLLGGSFLLGSLF